MDHGPELPAPPRVRLPPDFLAYRGRPRESVNVASIMLYPTTFKLVRGKRSTIVGASGTSARFRVEAEAISVGSLGGAVLLG